MKTRTFRSIRRFSVRGFTLIETLIVMVVLGVAAVTIASLTGNLFVGQAANRDIVVGTQLMQQCAEKIMAVRRSSAASAGYSNLNVSSCDGLPAPTGYAPATAASSPLTAGSAACPASSAGCSLWTISQGGLKPISLMLVK